MTRLILIAVCCTLARSQSMLDSACPCTARPSCSRILGEGEDVADVALISSLPACSPGLVRCCTRDDMFRTLRNMLTGLVNRAKQRNQISQAADLTPVPASRPSSAANSLTNLANSLGASVAGPASADSLAGLANSLGASLPLLTPQDSLTDLASSLGSTAGTFGQPTFFQDESVLDPLSLPDVGGQKFFNNDEGRSLLADALQEVQNFSPGDLAGAFESFPQQVDAQQSASSLGGVPSQFPEGPITIPGLIFPDEPSVADVAPVVPQVPIVPAAVPVPVVPAIPTVPVVPAVQSVPAIPQVPVVPEFSPVPAIAPILPVDPVVLPALVPSVPAAAPTFLPSQPAARPAAVPTFLPSQPAAPAVAPTFLPSQPAGPAAPSVSIIGPKPIYISNDVVKGPTVGGHRGGGSHAAGDGLRALLTALRQLF